MRSLRLRILTVALLLVIVLVATTLLLSRRAIVAEFDDFVQRGESIAAQETVTEIQRYIDRTAGLEGIEPLLGAIHRRTGSMIVLVSPGSGDVLAAEPEHAGTVTIAQQRDEVTIDINGPNTQTQLKFRGTLPTVADAKGTPLALVAVVPRSTTPSRIEFGGQVNRQLLIVAMIVGIAGVLLSVAASRGLMRPIEQQQDEVRRHLLNDVAHELRTPLAHVRAELEAVQDGLRQATPDVIDRLHRDALHLERLVDDLRDLALAESGQLRLDRRPTDVGAVIARVVESVSDQARTRGIRCDIRVDAAGEVAADPDRLRQILVNLVENALRHTPTDGAVDVAATRIGSTVRIVVTNDGEPVPDPHLAHLFDRFYRVDPSRDRRTGGVGLGLAIVRHLVAAHGGTVAAANAPSRGLAVSVTLPTA
jgi:signal transduction histidine kinase